ncbi:hypothetical protein [Hymenobacter radiodurans]|uniref:hypothetical protein n=1 Tax=Hymenobacter radiodurans TaxID=2496028 RepID=UPI0014043CCD|nr:hypothetical protein [Hymenobacter radiodurans]
MAQLAYRLATGQTDAKWPLPAGGPTNGLLEHLDFTVATKRPSLANSPLDGDVAAQQAMQDLYTGRPSDSPPTHLEKSAKPSQASAVQEPTSSYNLPPRSPTAAPRLCRSCLCRSKSLRTRYLHCAAGAILFYMAHLAQAKPFWPDAWLGWSWAPRI